MAATATRSAKALLAITVLWVGAYWWWQPNRPGLALISVGSAADRPGDLAEPDPARPSSPPPSEVAPSIAIVPEVETTETFSPAPIAFESYRVKAGDTLTRIAKRRYGSTRYADMIFKANRDLLTSPDRLDLGQQLRLPTDPSAWAQSHAPGD